jgi:hypothetical protein
MKKLFPYLIISLSSFLILLNSCEKKEFNRDVFLTLPGKPAISPSGEFILNIIEGKDRGGKFNRFEILEARSSNQKKVYECTDKFYVFHTTFIFWGEKDVAWVYSGDVGTFYWLRANDGSWEKHAFSEGKINAPQFLKKERPQFFH